VDVVPMLGETLDETSLSFFCDKAGRVFMPRFHDAVSAVKRYVLSKGLPCGLATSEECMLFVGLHNSFHNKSGITWIFFTVTGSLL
jgi:hypothetical protein